MGAPVSGTYKELLNSDDVAFGGAGTEHNKTVRSKKKPLHGFDQSITVTLPPMSALYYEVPVKRVRKTTADKPAAEKAEKTAKTAKTAKTEKAAKTTAKKTGEKAPAKRTCKTKAAGAEEGEKAPAKRTRKPKAEKTAE